MAYIRIPGPGSPPDFPSHEALQDDVGSVRSRGVGNPDQPLLDLSALLWIARYVSDAPTDEEKIEDTLRRAVQRLGGQTAHAIEALLGLTAETRGRSVRPRRTVAAEVYGYKTYEAFRTHYEKQLLLAVTTQFHVLVAERWVNEQLSATPFPPALSVGASEAERFYPAKLDASVFEASDASDAELVSRLADRVSFTNEGKL